MVHTCTADRPKPSKHTRKSNAHNSDGSTTQLHELSNDSTSASILNEINEVITIPEIILININGIQPTQAQQWKIKALEEKVLENNNPVPFIVITESHLKPRHTAAETHIQNYNIHRADRVNRKNGGVAIYYDHNLVPTDSATYTDDYCQAVCLYIKSLELIVSGVYRPPNANANQVESFRNMMQQIEKFIKKHPSADVQLQGDFNFKFINWQCLTMKPGHGQSLAEQDCAQILINLMQQNLLSQHVSENTRNNLNILDLVITNNADTIHSIAVEKSNLSDHDLVITRILNDNLTKEKLEEYNPENTFDKLNWTKARWDEIRSDLSHTHWEELFENKDIDQMCSVFNDTVSTVASKYCPEHIIRKNKYNIPRERRSLIRTRRHVISNINFLKYVKPLHNDLEFIDRNNKVTKLETKQLEIEEKIKQSIKDEVLRKEQEAISKIKVNPRAFYSYANQKRKKKVRIGPLVDSNGNLQADPKIMADLMQQQYVKVFSKPSTDKEAKSNHEPQINERVTLEDIEFSNSDILKAIDSMPNHSAPGPDKFPSVILKKCKQELASALYIMLRKSLDTGKVAKIHKEQTIVPIFKKDSKANPENYRPVSLTSHILKLFERVLRTKLVNFIEEQGLLSKEQYGFRPGRSTITQLLAHIDRIIQILERNQNADILYLDFSKAFDKVCHATLIKKLEGFGIRGKILKWLTSFLDERYQRVVIQGKLSTPEKVQSGVPQGTVLGPILFILYINDLTAVLKSSAIKIFADDSKLIKSIENEEDRKMLLEDLFAVIKWAEENKMELNESKFMLLQHGKNENMKQPYQVTERILLEKSEYAKDLGILVDSDLKFSQHIATVTASARQLTGWVLRVFRNRTKEVMLILYKTLIRPKLEYGCVVFNPQQIGDIAKLEEVQRTLTHKIENMDSLNYWERLKKLELYSAQRRRERYICIQMFKIYRGLLQNDMNLVFYESTRHGPKCRRNKLIAKKASINTTRCNSFSDVGATLFNILPPQIKQANTLPTFKQKLDRLFHVIPDCPPIPGYARQNNNSIRDWLCHESASAWRIPEEPYVDDEASQPEVVEPSLVQPAL